jgi:Mrp family chromosome partitioning ATPase
MLTDSCTLDEAIVRTTEFPICVLPAVTRRPYAVKLLGSPELRALPPRLRDVFKYVIVDSPPVGADADYDLIERVCDGVVMVVRRNHMK